MIRLSLVWALSLGLTLVPVANGQVFKGQTSNERQIGSWRTSVVTSPNTTVGRMVAASDARTTYMYLDAYMPDCTVVASFGSSFATPLAADVEGVFIPTTLRVDDGPLHRLQTTFSGTMGDTFGFATLDTTPEFLPLIKELKAGRTLRVRFDIPGYPVPTTEAFQLNGFSAGFNIVYGGCLAAREALQQAAPVPNPPAPRSSPNLPRTDPKTLQYL